MTKQTLVVSFMVEVNKPEEMMEVKKWTHHIEYLIQNAQDEEISNVKVVKVDELAAKVTMEVNVDNSDEEVGRIMDWENNFPIDDSYDFEFYDVKVMRKETLDRLNQADVIIKMLEEWKKYVSSLNECAYSDSMLRNVQKNLNKLYDNGFNDKTIRSDIFVTDDFIEDLNDYLVLEYIEVVSKEYVIKNFDRIIKDNTRKSKTDRAICEFICRRLGAYSEINK